VSKIAQKLVGGIYGLKQIHSTKGKKFEGQKGGKGEPENPQQFNMQGKYNIVLGGTRGRLKKIEKGK